MSETREKLLRYYRGTEGAEISEHLVDLAEQAEKSHLRSRHLHRTR